MSDGEIFAAMAAAIGTLFSALVYTLRQRAEEWRELYEQEREDKKIMLAEVKDTNCMLREVVAVIQHLPRRKTDWETRP